MLPKHGVGGEQRTSPSPQPQAMLEVAGAMGRSSAHGLSLAPCAVQERVDSEARRGASRAQCAWAGGGSGIPAQGWALPQGSQSDGTHKAQVVRPIAGFPWQTHPREHLSARPLWLASAAPHAETPTQTAHIRAHTQYYKHASTRTRTHTHVHFPSHTCPRTQQAYSHTHHCTNPHTLKKYFPVH